MIGDKPPEYTKDSLTEDQLVLARERAQHVIVLMLENRSYDHLFGFLGHPDIPNLEPDAYANPLDVSGTVFTDRKDAIVEVGVSPTATPRLEFDPPHGHVSAKTQLNADLRGNFRMNGFVTAYAQKLAGQDVPVVHWGRARLLAIPIALVLAAAFHDLARRAVAGGWASWGRFALVAAAAAVVVYLLTIGVKVRAIPGLRRTQLLMGIAVAAVVLGAAAAGWRRWIAVEPRGVWSWPIVTYALLLGALALAKDRLKVKPRLPKRALREQAKKIMSCMDPQHIPALGSLAKRYTTCTAWHSSVPGATWPNRNFAHAATSDESVDIEVGFYEDLTIFEVIDREHGSNRDGPDTWRIYHHDIPQVIAFHRLWEGENRKRWFDGQKLLDDIRYDRLPMYAFVEPCHKGSGANSQHPINNEDASAEDFVRGEALIACIYNELAARPDVFEKTVFLVTYDEHGGLFDHVPPPRSVHPEPDRAVRSKELARRLVSMFVESRNAPFDFRHLGVRVPAVVVSPWVVPKKSDDTVYDHASIVASLRRLFAPSQPPLSRRDEYANDFLHLLVASTEPSPPIDLETRYAGTAVGCVMAEMERDAAARGAPEEEVLLRDDFGDQLDKLSHLVRDRIAAEVPQPEPGPRQPVPQPPGPIQVSGGPLEIAIPSEFLPADDPVPTAELFKRYAAVDRA